MTGACRRGILAILIIAFSVLMPVVDRADAGRKSDRCAWEARRYADNRSAGNVVGGALVGAGVGGIIGAIVGGHHSVGTGAAIGAGVGTVGGIARGSDTWKRRYWKYYNGCMAS